MAPLIRQFFHLFLKNPTIARVFKEAGLADELGSGVRRLYASARAYGGQDPELVEDAVFRVCVTLPARDGEDASSQPSDGISDGISGGINDGINPVSSLKATELVLACLAKHPDWNLPEVAEALGRSLSTIERAVTDLRQGGRLRRVGSRKAGHWEILR